MHPAPVGHQCPECVKGAKQEFRRPGQRVGTRATGRSVTTVLLGVLILVYIAEVVVAGAGSLITGPSPRQLVDLGGSVGVLIAGGETWRMVTSTFLHIGIFHLAMNGYALYLFGTILEAEEGAPRFSAIYAVSALAASATSYAFGDPLVVSAGASGAIFGLFGAFLGTAWVKRDNAYYAARVRSAVSLILLNVLIAFAAPGIDWRAHLGGLVAGFFLGVAAAKRRTSSALFAAACAGVLVITVGLTVWRTNDLTSTFGI
jgi:membrane associated rhomboid family serine protease